MSNSEVPFYTQAAILERYIRSSDPSADPGTLGVILEMLQSREDLRSYFFSNRPDPAWATILWEHGFFAEPPSPREAEGGFVLPRWDAQEYLISVASQVPDIVLKHVASVREPGWYISRAIEALCFIPAEEAESAVPKILDWLENPQIANAIALKTCELIEKFAHEGRVAATVALFRELIAPLSLSDAKDLTRSTLSGGAVSKVSVDFYEKEVLSRGFRALKELDIEQLVAILEDHLCTAFKLEAEALGSPDFEFGSGWRTAVEETGQDTDMYYRDRLLQALRDALETWVQRDAAAVEPLLSRYLGEKREILRRLWLHLLHKFPAEYRGCVASELRKTENLDDVGIHYEFFMLLQRGYPYLEDPKQEALVAAICSGPPPDRVGISAAWAQQERGADPDEYIELHSKAWRRDRLWMLRGYLTGQAAQMLKELVAELEAPEHPAFTIWSSGPYWVQDVSPITEQEISEMSADELVSFLKRWQPEPEEQFGPERVSYRGLANMVARAVIANPQKYAEQLVSIALHHPHFARALLSPLREDEQARSLPWDLALDLCEKLLADDTVREDVSRAFGESWVGVRMSIVRLLQVGLNNPQRAVPAEHLPRARDILLLLVNDPDPDQDSDRPPEGWMGHLDPATVAINRVRSSALMALIEYAKVNACLARESGRDVTPEGPGPERLETVVRETLTKKLDRQADPSWAVHSGFGRYLSLLYWLDQGWVESHIDQIFPEKDDEQSTLFYAAAWDSFVVFNRFYPAMLEMLRSKYERAIRNLREGYVTQTYLQPEKHLAMHSVTEYLRADYDLRSPDGQQTLVAMFLNQAPPEARGGVPWWLWRIGETNPPQFEASWPRVRVLWEWRTQEASMANHLDEFDDEMQWFATLTLVAPSSESIATLWPLLEGALPHIAGSEHRNFGWDSVQKYLAREVDRDPVRAIQFYRLMHDQLAKPRMYYPDEARKIIETAAAHPDSRHETLSLIDLLARLGDYHIFQDVYDRYAG